MDLSKFFSLNTKDAVKGVVVAVLSAVLTAVYTAIQSGQMPTGVEWKNIAIIGLTAGISYVLKNLLTNSNGQLFKTEPKP